MQKKRIRNRGTPIDFTCNNEGCCHKYDLLPDAAKTQGCPYCAKKRLCKDISCKVCFDRSFASSERAIHWYWTENNCEPRECFKTSGKKYWFKCENICCNHDFQARLADVTIGTWCPYCANKIICKKIDCKICYNKSIESHIYAKYWSILNKESPRMIKIGTHKKYWFTCKNGHNIQTTLRGLKINKTTSTGVSAKNPFDFCIQCTEL